ncbi:MAG: glycosyltransferase family 4 protein [Patescibacteria group bacterium]
MSKRVVHITPVHPPYAGGVGMAAHAMAQGLAKRGWEVEVVTPKRGSETSKPLGHNVIELKPLIRIGNAAVVPQLAQLSHYNLIHLHVPFFGGAEFIVLGYWLKYLSALIRDIGKRDDQRKSAFVLQYHHDADAQGLRGIFFKLYDRVIMPLLISRADKVIVSSLDYAQNSRIAKYIDERFVEIPFGVDTKRFLLQDTNYKKQGTRVTILFVGSLDRAHWFKGLDVLLRAIVILYHNEQSISSDLYHDQYTTIVANRYGLELRCLVIGEGDDKEKYEKIVREMVIEGCVQFLGKVSHERLSEYYREADLFVFPSVSRAEAFGLVVLEAMASGLPVVVSDLPGVRTLVEEGVNGFKVPVNDPQALAQRIQQLMADQTLCNRMGQRSREKVIKSYTWDKTIDRLEMVYTHLIDR